MNTMTKKTPTRPTETPAMTATFTLTATQRALFESVPWQRDGKRADPTPELAGEVARRLLLDVLAKNSPLLR